MGLLQSDPIGLAGGINSFTYALGNPLSYADRDGRIAGPVLVGIGVIAAAIIIHNGVTGGSDVGSASRTISNSTSVTDDIVARAMRGDPAAITAIGRSTHDVDTARAVVQGAQGAAKVGGAIENAGAIAGARQGETLIEAVSQIIGAGINKVCDLVDGK